MLFQAALLLSAPGGRAGALGAGGEVRDADDGLDAQEGVQLLVGVAVRPLGEPFLVGARLLEAGDDVGEGVLDLLGGHLAVDGAGERGVRAQVAAQVDVVGFDLGAVVAPGEAALEADVADVVLGAGVGAAVHVDLQAALVGIRGDLFQVPDDLFESQLGLGDRQVAELDAGAGDGPAPDGGHVPRQARGGKVRLGGGQVFGGDVRDQHVLHVSQAHFARAVAVGDIGGLGELRVGQASGQDAQADPVQARLALGVDPDVVAVGVVGERKTRRGRLGRPIQFGADLLGEALGSPLGHQVLEPGARPLQPQLVGVAVALGDGSLDVHDLLDLVGGDKNIQRLAEEGLERQAAADEEVVADDAVVGPPVRDQRGVVDLRDGALDRRAFHGDLELARQVAEVAVHVEERLEGVDDRARVGQLLRVEARRWGRRQVARDVAARARRGQAAGVEPREDAGHIRNGQPVELDRLAGGQVGDAPRVDAGQVGQGAELLRRQPPAGDLDPHHEVAVVRALLVHAVPLETHEVARLDAAEAGLGVAVDVGQHVQPGLFFFQPFFFGLLLWRRLFRRLLDVAHGRVPC